MAIGGSIMNNSIEVKLKSIPENIKLARNIVASMLVDVDPTLSYINEVKSIVSEAVTNSIIHGYDSDETKFVDLKVELNENYIRIEVADDGIGIEDIESARMPMFTTKHEDERSGLGFTIMDLFSDFISIKSSPNCGTKVVCKRNLEKDKKAKVA